METLMIGIPNSDFRFNGYSNTFTISPDNGELLMFISVEIMVLSLLTIVDHILPLISDSIILTHSMETL